MEAAGEHKQTRMVCKFRGHMQDVKIGHPRQKAQSFGPTMCLGTISIIATAALTKTRAQALEKVSHKDMATLW